MRVLIYMFFISIFLSFCNDKISTEKKENNQKMMDTSMVVQYDSLDIDTSYFITTNFPDTAKQMLYKTNGKLFEFILQSYTLISTGDTLFSLKELKKIMTSKNFTIDSTKTETVFRRSSFNKCEFLEYKEQKGVIQLFIGNKLWFSGQKYCLHMEYIYLIKKISIRLKF